MRKDHAARTAQTVAFARAIESRRDTGRLFDDPFAVRFLDLDGRWALSLLGVPFLRRGLMSLFDRGAPGLYAYAVARTVYIDRALEAALGRGVAQVVILGAGYDCRALRIPAIDRARVFEVDHPDTQAVKRERLADLLDATSGRVSFVGIDFERQDLADRLRAAGFSFEQTAFFIWEGVTQYIDASAVDATLTTIARSAPGSELVFTYVDRGLIDGTKSFPAGGLLLATVRWLGEPFLFGMAPEDAAAYLRERGVDLLEDLVGDDFTSRYFEPAGRSDRAGQTEHVALARVRSRPPPGR